MAQQRPTRIPTPYVLPRGAPGLVMGPFIYQLEVNWCRNEEIIVKGNFGWEWPMWAGCPRIDRIVIREVQYQFEVNWCRNEEIIVKLQFWVGVAYVGGVPQGWFLGPCIVEIDGIIREVRY
ncbi:hypothetical protein DPMN_014047 [Dreissena polymorpha]|uniref:Uncharacterized protein n=1 Tax=Dreissena polymorpha TaxID=45954 RepID=A0A9D4S473_DREPO|nr:hypothetical protein DPMN_014047 [Dreissena polymorpha]